MASAERILTPNVLADQAARICGFGEASFYTAGPSGQPLVWQSGPKKMGEINLPNLARWLRVNDRACSTSTRGGPIEDISAPERAWLQAHAVRVCIPLVKFGRLLAVMMLHDESPPGILTPSTVDKLSRWSRGAASEWLRLLQTRDRDRESAAAFRAQQLSTTGQLAASVAHEVRNPLAAIRSITQLIRDEQPPADEQASLLGDVIEEVDRIDHTVSGLLGLAREHPSNVSSCDVGALCDDAIRFIAPLMRKRGIHLVLELGVSASVRVDPREFRQILLNLILNAYEACEVGNTITIATSASSTTGYPCVLFSIADTGSGIEVEALQQVFDPFFTTKQNGSGLGLPISRKLVRQYGGELTIMSTRGHGTAVTISLPLAEPG
jgi:signal transduction histidine kinase